MMIVCTYSICSYLTNCSQGSPVDCGLYLCCRKWYNGTVCTPDYIVVHIYAGVYDQYFIVQGSAGHYGSHQCDLPMVTLNLLLDTLRDLDPQPDFYIYTGVYPVGMINLPPSCHHCYSFAGDNPPHDIWNETWTSQLNATDYIVNYVASKLPNVTIYPAFGNHGKLCCRMWYRLTTCTCVDCSTETWPESEYIGTLPKYEVYSEPVLLA